MNQVKRFIKWLIDNDIAFTRIDETVRAFKKQDNVLPEFPKLGDSDSIDALSTSKGPYWVWL